MEYCLTAPKVEASIVLRLLKQGQNPNQKDLLGTTAFLHLASTSKITPELIRLFIEAGADPNDNDSLLQNALHKYVFVGAAEDMAFFSLNLIQKAKVIEMLVRAGCDIQAPDLNGNTCLMLSASHYRSFDALPAVLLRLGADPNTQNKAGHTFFTRMWLDEQD